MDIASQLAFFVVLAKKGSISAAARELDVTPPAISKRLAQLERRLGVRLVNRTTRRVSLTNEGEVYLAKAARILTDIQELEHLVSSSRAEPKGLLRVNATLGFGRRHIAPAISDFVKLHPAVDVQLQLTDRPLNLAEEAYDVGIRFGEPPNTRVSARKIAANRRVLCAAPAYLKKFGTPRCPNDLTRHNCIVLRQDDAAYGLWRFQNGRDAETVKVRGSLSSNDGEVTIGWALAGYGILMRSEWDTAEHIRSGTLRRILSEFALPPADVYAVYPQRHNLSARVRAFIDFLVVRFRDGAVPSISHAEKSRHNGGRRLS